jgi:demethylmenaquinone methyltransferase / 2-methoxy-6-polyprenyl-1,4-benzoquinol methylase
LAADVDEHGFFGPDSVSWRVHREVTVLFGGARAILMQAAHPLVIAGARETGFYERDPWRRLQRTLMLTYALTFGTVAEANDAAARIHAVHRTVHGVDPVTGRPYDALDPDLLLWVHAALVDSALLFERYTVGRLDDAGRQRFHEEQMAAAELVGLSRERIPATVPELQRYIDGVVRSGDLQVTDAARAVASLFRRPPPEAEWRPVLHAVAWWAFGTLPPPLRDQYGVRWNPAREVLMRANLRAVRVIRPVLPSRLRFILPAQAAAARTRSPSGSARTSHARRLFAGIAPEYDRMAELLSFGQNGRWRRFMVSRLPTSEDGWVLDVATGTAGVAVEIARRTGSRVVGVDQSPEMLAGAREALANQGFSRRVSLVLAQGERLPFADGSFRAVTFTYLLRYVDDPPAVLRELGRVLAPGGVLANLEFLVPPNPAWRAAWVAYTRLGLPLGGLLASADWFRTGRFLGPSISEFYRRYPLAEQGRWWREAGIEPVRYRAMSLGGGIVIWGSKSGA